MSRGHAVGIDFGTTNSVVAHGAVASAGVIRGEDDDPLLPSVVSFTDEGALVGRTATERIVAVPRRTVHGVKRRLGDDHASIPGVDGATYTPAQVASLVFSKLKTRAERELGAPVTNAVVTVPAYFGHRQREATRRAARIAGLGVDRLLSEPTAACLSYGVGAIDGGDTETVLVYDLGGGTFDVSLVDVTGGVFDVVASKGDTRLGGDDWDDRIVEWLRSRLDATGGESGHDAAENASIPSPSDARLRRAARRARHALTEQSSATVEVESRDGETAREFELTRDDLDELTGDLVDRTVDICAELLHEADTNPWVVDRILLVGGATRMPQIRDAVYEFFGEVPSADVDPDEIVATGAAIQASIINDGPITDTAGSAAVRSPDGGTDAVVVDVVPQPLGVETNVDGEPGYFSPVIGAHSSIPTERTRHYRTVRDDQRSVSVRVYQGDGDRVDDNEYLGSFVLSGLPEADAGEVSVEVSFEVTENGTLRVRAAEDATGQTAGVTIESPFDGLDGELRRAREELPQIR